MRCVFHVNVEAPHMLAATVRKYSCYEIMQPPSCLWSPPFLAVRNIAECTTESSVILTSTSHACNQAETPLCCRAQCSFLASRQQQRHQLQSLLWERAQLRARLHAHPSLSAACTSLLLKDLANNNGRRPAYCIKGSATAKQKCRSSCFFDSGNRDGQCFWGKNICQDAR